MFMAAIETSIISLAMPTIRRPPCWKQYIISFTIYFVALVIANPIVGELLTRYKIIYIAATGLFLFGLGSLMSGLSPTFAFLITSRAIQGLGAG